MSNIQYLPTYCYCNTQSTLQNNRKHYRTIFFELHEKLFARDHMVQFFLNFWGFMFYVKMEASIFEKIMKSYDHWNFNIMEAWQETLVNRCTTE